MNCEEATELMDGYLDGELDPITGQTIEQLITRRLRDCVNEFNLRCEKRSPNDHREASHEIYRRYFRRYFRANRQNDELFLSEHNGAGWHLPLQSSWLLSSPLT